MERKSTAIFAESKNTEIFAEPSFFLFRYLFLVMSYLGDRKRKWQTTANSAETGSCLHEIWQGLWNQVWLQVTRSRMAGQEGSQIGLLSFLCASSSLWMRGKYNNSAVIGE